MKTTLLINCPDKAGIIGATSNFIHQQNGNVIYLDQHVDKDNNTFFMRIEIDFNDTTFNRKTFAKLFKKAIALQFAMRWSIHFGTTTPKMAIWVSKYNHCLYDLLSRYQAGELDVEIPFILSNHKDLKSIAEQFTIPFYHIPVTKENKAIAEAKQLKLLNKHKIDFIVLARYMQIVTPMIIKEFPHKIINIHHSFLPAFAGAKPYHAAFDRGVKIIGATSHYVTEELDAGPIIEQDVTPVSHTHHIEDFLSKGRDLEKIVLARAVKLHINRKTLVHKNKTIIFS